MGITYDKGLTTPKMSRRTVFLNGVTVGGDHLDKLNVKWCRNLRPKAGTLTSGEGATFVARVDDGATVFECEDMVFYYVNERLYYLQGVAWVHLKTCARPVAIFPFMRTDGKTAYIVATEDGLFVVAQNYYSYGTTPISDLKASAACQHHGRVFVANGNTVYYSEPLTEFGWERGIDKSGHIHLPSQRGEIVALVPFQNSIYCFRKYGVTRLKANGDPLNFTAVETDVTYDEVYPRSIKVCNDRVYLFTKSGLYRFRGGAMEYLGYATLADGEVIASEYRGDYYASVSEGGMPRLFHYIEAEKSGYIIDSPSIAIARGGDHLYSLCRDGFYRVTESGTPENGARVYAFETDNTAWRLLDGEKSIERITVLGTGKIMLTVTGENECTFEATCGTCTDLPVAVRGRVFRIYGESGEPFTLSGMILGVKEGAYDN